MTTLERANRSETGVVHLEGSGDGPSAPRAVVTPPFTPISLGKAMVVSVVACTVGFLLGATFAVLVTTGDLVESLGIGAFAALWGGIGFGLMAGGATYTLGQEKAARTALLEQRALVVDRNPPPVWAPATDGAVTLAAP